MTPMKLGNVGIRTKLIGTTLGLLLILTAGSLLTIRHFFGQQLRQQAAREVRIAGQVLRSIIERSGGQLTERGKLLVELPSLQTALLNQPRQLEPLLLEVKALRTANLLWATDARGTVLSSTGEYPPPGQNLADSPFIRAGLAGSEWVGFDLFQGEWWLVLTLPVKATEPAVKTRGKKTPARDPSQPIGTVTLALLINDAYLARLSELLSTEVGFVWGEHSIWSEGFPETARKEIGGQVVRGLARKPQESSPFGEDRLLWLSTPVTGGSPPIAAGPLAVLAIRLDESVIQRTTRAIGWISLLTMVLGAFLSTGVVRPLFAQLETAQARLVQSEKLASIGQLAAGVAHELNNPLMVIMGSAQLALRTLTRGKGPLEEQRSELTELMKSLDQEAHRSKGIVSNLLDFSRVRPPSRTATDLHQLLEESLKLMEHQAGLQQVQVIRKYQENLPPLQIDPNQIKQVLLNLLLNAVQAMPQGGTLTLETGRTDRAVSLTIADTGVGIPEDQVAKVFDPFFTTKEVGQGTGLGLYVSYGIVQRHGGEIALKSTVGHGTTLTLTLPL